MKNKIIDLINNSEYCNAAEIAGELKDILNQIRFIDLKLIKSFHKYSDLLEKRTELKLKYQNKCTEIQKYPKRIRGIIQSFVRNSEDPYEYIIKYINIHKNEINRN